MSLYGFLTIQTRYQNFDMRKFSVYGYGLWAAGR